MRWKIFQWMKFLFRHSSNSRKLSRQKFQNELACVFTAHFSSKNADWNQQQLTDVGILANRNSANHPYGFLSNQKKVQILAFLHVIRQRNVSCPLPVLGRGHDLRLRMDMLQSHFLPSDRLLFFFQEGHDFERGSGKCVPLWCGILTLLALKSENYTTLRFLPLSPKCHYL